MNMQTAHATKNVRRPQVAKRPFSRMEAEPFDPAKVSTHLNVIVALNVKGEAARVNAKMGRS